MTDISAAKVMIQLKYKCVWYNLGISPSIFFLPAHKLAWPQSTILRQNPDRCISLNGFTMPLSLPKYPLSLWWAPFTTSLQAKYMYLSEIAHVSDSALLTLELKSQFRSHTCCADASACTKYSAELFFPHLTMAKSHRKLWLFHLTALAYEFTNSKTSGS